MSTTLRAKERIILNNGNIIFPFFETDDETKKIIKVTITDSNANEIFSICGEWHRDKLIDILDMVRIVLNMN